MRTTWWLVGRRLALISIFSLGLAACGGGSDSPTSGGAPSSSTSSSTSSTSTTSSTSSTTSTTSGGTVTPVTKVITVVPGLGGFGAGANTSALRPDGTTIGTAQTGADGKASVNFGTYDGPFILKVTGGPGVTYYNEKAGTNDPFSASDTLLSVIPASTVVPGAAFGVNPLTHMVAAAAGIDPASPKVEGLNTAAIIASISSAKEQVYKVLGVSETTLDILAAPVMVTAQTKTVSAATTAGTLGLLLAELAKAAPGNPLDQAKGFFTAMSSARAAAFTGSAAAGSFATILAPLSKATTAVATGQSSFATAGTALPSALVTQLSNAATTAATLVTASTGVTVQPGGVVSTTPPVASTSGGTTTTSSSTTTTTSTSSTSTSSTSSSSSTSSTSTTTGGSVDLSTAYPVGLAISSPTDFETATSQVVMNQMKPTLFAQVKGWGQAVRHAAVSGNKHELGRLAVGAMPISNAWAQTASNPKVPAGVNDAYKVKVLANATSASQSEFRTGVQNMVGGLFEPAGSNNANCFGRSTFFRDHPEVTTANTMFLQPGGDTGMSWPWENTYNVNETSVSVRGEPCSVAQMNRLMDSLKKQVNAALGVSVGMAAVAKLGAKFPASGATATLTSDLGALMPSGKTVSTATLQAVSSTRYVYGLKLSDSSSSRTTLVNIDHSGSSSSVYSGVLQFVQYGGTGGFQANCGSNTVVTVSTVRYQRVTDVLHYRVITAPFCVSSPSSITPSTIGTYASLTANGEIKLADSRVQNSTKGWQDNLRVFAASVNPTYMSGDYAFAWQAGAGDGKSRVFLMDLDRYDRTGGFTARAHFGYAGPFSSDGQDDTSVSSDRFYTLQGMACSWGVPDTALNTTPNANFFQTQHVVLGDVGKFVPWAPGPRQDTNWSKTQFSPTSTCNSGSSLKFDNQYRQPSTGTNDFQTADATALNAGGSTASSNRWYTIFNDVTSNNIGLNATNNLDTFDSGLGVMSTILNRGFVRPYFFGGTSAELSVSRGSGSGSGSGSGAGTGSSFSF